VECAQGRIRPALHGVREQVAIDRL
jgi:hypothetical protein